MNDLARQNAAKSGKMRKPDANGFLLIAAPFATSDARSRSRQRNDDHSPRSAAQQPVGAIIRALKISNVVRGGRSAPAEGRHLLSCLAIGALVYHEQLELNWQVVLAHL